MNPRSPSSPSAPKNVKEPKSVPTWPEWIHQMFALFMGMTALIWLWYGACLLLVPDDFPWVLWAEQHSIIHHIQVVAAWFIFIGVLKLEAATRQSDRWRKFVVSLAMFTTVSWIVTRETIAIVSGFGALEACILWVYVLGCNFIAVMALSPGNTPPTPLQVVSAVFVWTWHAGQLTLGWIRRQSKTLRATLHHTP